MDYSTRLTVPIDGLEESTVRVAVLALRMAGLLQDPKNKSCDTPSLHLSHGCAGRIRAVDWIPEVAGVPRQRVEKVESMAGWPGSSGNGVYSHTRPSVQQRQAAVISGNGSPKRRPPLGHLLLQLPRGRWSQQRRPRPQKPHSETPPSSFRAPSWNSTLTPLNDKPFQGGPLSRLDGGGGGTSIPTTSLSTCPCRASHKGDQDTSSTKQHPNRSSGRSRDDRTTETTPGGRKKKSFYPKIQPNGKCARCRSKSTSKPKEPERPKLGLRELWKNLQHGIDAENSYPHPSKTITESWAVHQQRQQQQGKVQHRQPEKTPHFLQNPPKKTKSRTQHLAIAVVGNDQPIKLEGSLPGDSVAVTCAGGLGNY